MLSFAASSAIVVLQLMKQTVYPKLGSLGIKFDSLLSDVQKMIENNN
jgi:hypothetical protein